MTPDQLKAYWTPERILELRQQLGVTLEAFGTMLEFSHARQRAWEIESGTVSPSFRVLIMLEHLKDEQA